MNTIEVAAGVVRRKDGRVLICRRTGALDGLWEFPGGKLEPGESAETCLRRELMEELSLSVCTEARICTFAWRDGERELCFTFINALAEGDGALEMRVHGAVAWITADEWKQYRFCPADQAFLSQYCDRVGFDPKKS